MSNFIKLGFLALLFVASGITIFSLHEQNRDQTHLGPPVIISISPAEPTTKDRITITVKALDYSRGKIERISVVVNNREVKACLYLPCIYRGGPYPEGSLSYEVKVYGYTDVDPWTGPRRVYVKKATRFEPQRIRTLRLSKGRIDLMPLAENEDTRWSNGTFALPFPGDEGDNRGFACFRYDSVLEDDKVYSKVLLTHPELRFIRIFDSITNQYLNLPYEFGRIIGILKIEDLPEGAIFKTKVGFLKGAYQSDGVEFRVFVDRDPSYYAANVCYYDGHLDDLEINLDRYAGQEVSIVLQVNAINTSTQDWAVWVDPRIE
jgi:hypothetical protein